MGASESQPNVNNTKQILEDQFSKKISTEVINLTNNSHSTNTKTITQFFETFIKEKYRGNMADFYRIYRVKTNHKTRKEFIYEVYTVENKYTKVLFNLKVFTKSTDVFKFNQAKFLMEKNLLINDLMAMQEFESPVSQNLISTYMYILSDNFFFLMITSYSTNVTLLDKMNEKIMKSQKFTEGEIDMIMRFLFEILDKMRHSNLVHRGLSPSAIYFVEDNNYSSLIVRNYFFSAVGFTAKGLTGSLWYSAPEVLKDSDQDFKVDIYSAGIILYQCITLENPYQNLYTKEAILDSIDKNVIEKSFHRFIKINYQSKYFEIILKMTNENKFSRLSLDELISDKTVKDLRMKTFMNNIKNKTNLFFNLTTNYLILDEMINKLNKINKELLGLIYYWFYNMSSYIIDKSQFLMLNYLFDFFDSNKNNAVTSSEFRDKMADYHINTVNYSENENNKEKDKIIEPIKTYSNKFKLIMDLILKNSYCRLLELSQVNFHHFCTIVLIFNFFDEKERRKLIDSNTNINRGDKNWILEKSLNKTQFTNKSIRKIYGDFDIVNVECLQETNENKLYAVFNYYLKTESFFEFKTLVNIIFPNKFNTMEEKLENHYKDNLFTKGSDGNNYLSKDNFIKMMELEFDGPPN